MGIMSDEERIAWIQAARAAAYRTLARVFAAEADDELHTLVRQREVREAFEVLGGPEALTTLDSLENLDRSDYAALFVGPGPEQAPPWESAYRASDGLVMGKVTLEVREAFAKAGFRAPERHHVPDDHVATELDFLGALCLKPGTEAVQALFIDEHLGLWVDRFAARVNNARPQSPYAQAAALLASFVRNDRALLDEIIVVE